MLYRIIKLTLFPQGQGAIIRLLKRNEDINTVFPQKPSNKVFINSDAGFNYVVQSVF